MGKTLPPEIQQQIFARIAAGESRKKIAEDLGIDRSSICRTLARGFVRYPPNKDSKSTAYKRAYNDSYRRKPEVRYNALRAATAKRNLAFDLSYEEFIALDALPCAYCNNEMLGGMKHCRGTGSGIDRIDNERGYESDNVQPCCTDCNLLRNNLFTVGETKVAIQAILAVRRKNASLEVPYGTKSC